MRLRFFFRIAAVVGLAAAIFQSAFAQAAPAWWSASPTNILDPTTPTDNWAIANTGQLKNIATQAKAHLDAKLGLTTQDWDNAYASGANPFPFLTQHDPDNFAPANIGQVKFIVSAFYTILHARAPSYDIQGRLLSIGVPSSAISGSGPYFPWAASTLALENYSPVTIGQLKAVFSFDLTNYATPVSAPGSDKATSFGMTYVSLSWSAATAPAGIARYDIYRNGVLVGSTTGTSYVDSTVNSSQNYAYSFLAIDNQGNVSLPSAPVNVLTLSGPQPAQPVSGLPYRCDFESAEGFTLGSLDGQNGWALVPGSAQISNSDAQSGICSVVIQPNASQPTDVQRWVSCDGTPNVVFVDFYAKGVADPDLNAATQWYVGAVNWGLHAVNGTSVVSIFTGYQWFDTGKAIPLNANGQTANWVRFTVRIDYTAQTWNLYVDGQFLISSVLLYAQPFDAADPLEFDMTGHAVTPALLDNFYVGVDDPLPAPQVQTVATIEMLPDSATNNLTYGDAAVSRTITLMKGPRVNVTTVPAQAIQNQFESVASSVFSIDPFGTVSFLAPGTGVAHVTSTVGDGQVITTDVLVPPNGAGMSTTQLQGFSPSSVAFSVASYVDSHLAGQTPTPATTSMFTVRDDTNVVYQRNPNLWCSDIASQLSAVTVWHSPLPGGPEAGTLISPHHILYAAHFGFRNGWQVRFVATDGQVVMRTIVAIRNVPNTDIALAVLDSDLPSTVPFVHVLPKTAWESVLPNYSNQALPADVAAAVRTIPLIQLDQTFSVSVSDLQYIGRSTGTLGHLIFSYDLANFSIPTEPQRALFYKLKVTGDSGHPSFLVINNQLVLIAAFTSPLGGPFDSSDNNYDGINSAMLALENTAGLQNHYQLTPIDLGAFTQY